MDPLIELDEKMSTGDGIKAVPSALSRYKILEEEGTDWSYPEAPEEPVRNPVILQPSKIQKTSYNPPQRPQPQLPPRQESGINIILDTLGNSIKGFFSILSQIVPHEEFVLNEEDAAEAEGEMPVKIMSALGIPTQMRHQIYQEACTEVEVLQDMSAGAFDTIGNVVKWVVGGETSRQDLAETARTFCSTVSEVDADDGLWQDWQENVEDISEAVEDAVADGIEMAKESSVVLADSVVDLVKSVSATVSASVSAASFPDWTSMGSLSEVEDVEMFDDGDGEDADEETSDISLDVEDVDCWDNVHKMCQMKSSMQKKPKSRKKQKQVRLKVPEAEQSLNSPDPEEEPSQSIEVERREEYHNLQQEICKRFEQIQCDTISIISICEYGSDKEPEEQPQMQPLSDEQELTASVTHFPAIEEVPSSPCICPECVKQREAAAAPALEEPLAHHYISPESIEPRIEAAEGSLASFVAPTPQPQLSQIPLAQKLVPKPKQSPSNSGSNKPDNKNNNPKNPNPPQRKVSYRHLVKKSSECITVSHSHSQHVRAPENRNNNNSPPRKKGSYQNLFKKSNEKITVAQQYMRAIKSKPHYNPSGNSTAQNDKSTYFPKRTSARNY